MCENDQSDFNNLRKDEHFFDSIHSQGIKHSHLKMGGLILFMAICIVVANFTPIKEYVNHLYDIKRSLSETGFLGSVIFFAVFTFLIFFGAPRLALCSIAGMFFGFVQGLIISQLATMIGAYGPFMFGRWFAGKWVKKKLAHLKNFQKYLNNPSIFDVFVCRQLFIWGVLINLLLGTTRLTHFRFIVGSLLGFFPQGVIFTLIGSGIADKSFLLTISKMMAALPLVVASAIVTRWIVDYVKNGASYKDSKEQNG